GFTLNRFFAFIEGTHFLLLFRFKNNREISFSSNTFNAFRKSIKLFKFIKSKFLSIWFEDNRLNICDLTKSVFSGHLFKFILRRKGLKVRKVKDFHKFFSCPKKRRTT